MKKTTQQQEKNEYDEQAEAFLTKTKTSLIIEFKEHNFYFDDDEQKRDIYNITLIRGERKFKFTFGNSFLESGKYILYGYTDKGNYENLKTNDEKLFKKHKANHKQAIRNKDFKIPSAYSIFSSLTKYEPNDFNDFCDEYGYSNDSIKALKIYEKVKNEFNNLKMIYNDAELNLLREIN